MIPPKFPPSKIIREGTLGTCPKCHSTEERRRTSLFFGKTVIIGCINSDCENYYRLTDPKLLERAIKVNKIIKNIKNHENLKSNLFGKRIF